MEIRTPPGERPAEAVASGASCPVCAEVVATPVRRCERCDTPHHPDCWDYVGHCAIFGCEVTLPAPRPEESPVERRSTARLVSTWARLFRLQWTLMVHATLGIVGGIGLTSLGMGGPDLLLWVLGLVGLLLYLLVLPASLLFRLMLERRLGARLALPRQGVTRLLGSTELTPTRGRVETLLRRLPFAWFLLVLGAHSLLGAPRVGFYLGILGTGLFLALYRATRVRLAFVESIQNRLVASSKGLTAPGLSPASPDG